LRIRGILEHQVEQPHALGDRHDEIIAELELRVPLPEQFFADAAGDASIPSRDIAVGGLGWLDSVTVVFLRLPIADPQYPPQQRAVFRGGALAARRAREHDAAFPFLRVGEEHFEVFRLFDPWLECGRANGA
jgi:hypothetical protein